MSLFLPNGSHPNPKFLVIQLETTSSIKDFRGAYNTATGKMNALLTLPTTEPFIQLLDTIKPNYAGGHK